MFPSCAWPSHGGFLLSLCVGKMWYRMVVAWLKSLAHRKYMVFFARKHEITPKLTAPFTYFSSGKSFVGILQNSLLQLL